MLTAIKNNWENDSILEYKDVDSNKLAENVKKDAS